MLLDACAQHENHLMEQLYATEDKVPQLLALADQLFCCPNTDRLILLVGYQVYTCIFDSCGSNVICDSSSIAHSIHCPQRTPPLRAHRTGWSFFFFEKSQQKNFALEDIVPRRIIGGE